MTTFVALVTLALPGPPWLSLALLDPSLPLPGPPSPSLAFPGPPVYANRAHGGVSCQSARRATRERPTVSRSQSLAVAGCYGSGGPPDGGGDASRAPAG